MNAIPDPPTTAPAAASIRLRGQRILIVLGSLELGGTERQAIQLACWLQDEQRAEVQVWGFSPPGGAAALCDAHHIPWRSQPHPWSGGKATKLRHVLDFLRQVRQAKPAILLPYTVLPNILCGLVWRLSPARTCLWNQRDVGELDYSLHAQRLAAMLTPTFVANAQHSADFLQRTFHLHPSRIHVIHNGVPLLPLATPQERNAWRQQNSLPQDSFVACMVANLRQPKDHLTLIQAWKIVVDTCSTNGKQAVLLLAGKFMETYPQAQALTREMHLEEHVRFLGQVRDVPSLLTAADLGVFSSRHEGSPNGVLECMAAGLPVAATDIPGIREVVGPEGEAFLSPSGDAARFAQNILALLNDPAQSARLGQHFRQRIQEQFSPGKMYREMAELMERAV